MLNRREFNLRMASVAMGGLATASCSKLGFIEEIPRFRTRRMPLAPRYPELESDPAGLLDLPPGFSYRRVSGFEDVMDDGFLVPDNADGMGAFPIDNRLMALVRNHELEPADAAKGAVRTSAPRTLAMAYPGAGGALAPGGTTTIIYDYQACQVESVFLSLVGTVRNCAGGVTPWDTWLTCEEVGDSSSPAHGWVFEVPATRPCETPRPLLGLGRFKHEAAAVHPDGHIIYMTEDQPDGLFYRFLMREPRNPAASGTLQALAYKEGRSQESRNWRGPGTDLGTAPRPVRWVDLDADEMPLRRQGRRKEAVLFARGEGIIFGQDELFFCCTNGGPIKSGQIMRYSPSEETIQVFIETTDHATLNYCDNLVLAPDGDLVICEDAYFGGQRNFWFRDWFKGLGHPAGAFLRGISPNGEIYNIARLRPATELAGACFSPDGRILFVNVYSPAQTLAITGPWQWQAPHQDWRARQCPT